MRYLLYVLTRTKNDEVLEGLCEKGLPYFIEPGDVIADIRRLVSYRPTAESIANFPLRFHRKCNIDIVKLLVFQTYISEELIVFARHIMSRPLTKPEIRKLVEGRDYETRKMIYQNIEIINKHADGFKQLPLTIESLRRAQ